MGVYKKIADPRVRRRLRRKAGLRKRISGTAEVPRLSVFRSAKHIYVQAVDDTANKVLASASDLQKELKGEAAGKAKKEVARLVGKKVAESLKAQNISSVVFDRNGFVYHGRVKEVADGAREAGLEF